MDRANLDIGDMFRKIQRAYFAKGKGQLVIFRKVYQVGGPYKKDFRLEKSVKAC